MEQDTWLSLISPLQVQQPFRFLQIAIEQYRNGGIDCKVHGIQLIGLNVGHALRLDDTTARLLPPDFEQEQNVPVFQKTRQLSTLIQNSSCATRVFVWGLNDEDQLGGTKGSKIKIPQLSETMASLQPGGGGPWSRGVMVILANWAAEDRKASVDRLSGLGVCHVECGAQFSVALTCHGHVRFVHMKI